MYFKPKNEKMLENLVASEYFYRATKIKYLGGCLNSSGTIETSPDMLVYDNRAKEGKILRCECKYTINNYNAFAENGRFDIAIIWDYDSSKKETLTKQLYLQNDCKEIIILTEYKEFRYLNEYDNNIFQLNKLLIDELYSKLRKLKYETVWVAYIFCYFHFKQIPGKMIMELLLEEFENIRIIPTKGSANIWSTLAQKSINIINQKEIGKYKWNSIYNPHISLGVIKNILIDVFEKKLPNESILDKIKLIN